jgi:hypothetical protein
MPRDHPNSGRTNLSFLAAVQYSNENRCGTLDSMFMTFVVWAIGVDISRCYHFRYPIGCTTLF